MAEYNITVQLLKSALLTMTAEQIRDALETLTEGNRLDAAFIDNLPSGGGDDMTPTEIVNAINSLGGASPAISYGQVTTIPKSRILHCEKALNLIYEGDPRSSAFKALFSDPNTDRIKINDYIYVAQVYQDTELFHNGDWVIARADDPGWDYSDTSKWLILELSKLDEVEEQVFRRHSESTTGIENAIADSDANGAYSFSAGQSTIANGIASTALGKESKAIRQGEVAISSGKRLTVGDQQRSYYQMNTKTTHTTEALMLYSFNTNTTYLLDIKIVAVVGGGKKAKHWHYRYLTGIDSDGYTPRNGYLMEDDILQFGTPNISVTVTIPEYDATTPPPTGVFKGLQIFCSGLPNTTVYWSAFVDAYEVGNYLPPPPLPD